MYHTVKQVADQLNVSIAKVYKLIADGDLVAHRFGSAIRVSKVDLEDYLLKCRKVTTREPKQRVRRLPKLKHLKLR